MRVCDIYVTAAGGRLVIPISTFLWAGVGNWPVYVLGHYGDLVWDGCRILRLIEGGHALTSPKGGRHCSLGLSINLIQCKRSPVICTSTAPIQNTVIPARYGTIKITMQVVY